MNTNGSRYFYCTRCGQFLERRAHECVCICGALLEKGVCCSDHHSDFAITDGESS